MRNYSVLIGTLLMATPIWGASSSSRPADDTRQQSSPTEVTTVLGECQVSQWALDYIESVKSDLNHTALIS